MKNSHILIMLAIMVLVATSILAQPTPTPTPTPLPAYFNGITIEDATVLTAEQRAILRNLSTPTVVRVVFQSNTEANVYAPLLDDLHHLNSRIVIMGELVDSDFLARYRWECNRHEGCTPDENRGSAFLDYKTRIDTYLKVLACKVDIWEAGNEVNGEWADEGCIKKANGSCISDRKQEKDVSGLLRISIPVPGNTANKIKYAVDEIKKLNKPVALTLIHQPDCTTWAGNTMEGWAAAHLKPLLDQDLIDYLLISYYEDNCDKGKSTIADEKRLSDHEKKSLTKSQKEQRRRDIYWKDTFDSLENIFVHPELIKHLAFGEVGYSSDMATCPGDPLSYCRQGQNPKPKLTLLNRYYGMKVDNQKYIGGHFWWTAQSDMTCPDHGTDRCRPFLDALTGFFNAHP